MLEVLRWLSARSLYVTAVGVFVGYALPELANTLRPVLPYAIAGMMIVSMMRIAVNDVTTVLKRWPIIIALIAWLVLASPVIMWMVVAQFDVPQAMGLAIILTAACPPLMSTVGLAWILGLNPPLALVVVTAATLVCPALLAGAFLLLPATGIELDAMGLFLRLSALVCGCYVAAIGLRRVMGAATIARLGFVWDLTIVFLLVLFAIAIMDGVAARAEIAPTFVLGMLGVAFLVNLAMQGAGILVAWRLGVSSALTVGFASGNRAVGLLLAVAPGDASNDLVLFFALYQVPMYTLPSILRPLYRQAFAWGARN
jgi:predicted Na+-dependent transporter